MPRGRWCRWEPWRLLRRGGQQRLGVDRFLACLSEAMMLAVQLMQQFMSDEQIQRITGGNGLPVARSVEEIQGRYDVTLSFDVRDLNMDYLKAKAELALKYARPLDTRNTTQWELISNRILQSVDPNLAEESIVPVEVAEIIGEFLIRKHPHL